MRPPTDKYLGYKVGAQKTAEEYAQLDAEDESLARWKASLGIVPGATDAAAGPKVSAHIVYVACHLLRVLLHLLGYCLDARASLPYTSCWQNDRL